MGFICTYVFSNETLYGKIFRGVDKMNILNFEISKKTEEEINNITKNFQRPVEYADIQEIHVGGFGAVYYENPEKYILFLSTDLNNTDFETNVLSELHHIRQAEEKYPRTFLKRCDTVLQEKNPMFFSYLDHSLQSAVYDLDVMTRLKETGHSIEFYISNRLNQILKIDLKSNMADKYNYASFGIQFIMFCLTASKSEQETAAEFLNKNFNFIADHIYPYAEKIKETGFDTPLACAKCIMYIIDVFNLWDVEYVSFGDIKVKTHKSYLRFLEENK